MNSAAPSSVGIESWIEQGLGRIRLDRPAALNALNLTMVEQLWNVLSAWSAESLRAVIIDSSTPRAYSAGGDVRQMRQNVLDGDTAASLAFLETEYRVNNLMATYPVPVIALIDGVCMGGGIGISAHGTFRVAGDRALFAMPETAIGFFPDVGTSHLLPRLPGAVGMYLGLTGARLSVDDALAVGLATHHVPSERLHEIPERIAADDRPIDVVLRELSAEPGTSELAGLRGDIDRIFGAPSLEVIIDRLGRDGSEWAASMLKHLNAVSRQSLEITYDLLVWGAQRSLRESLDAELAVAEYVLPSADFIEGVRAVLVDKDHAPDWGPSQYRGVRPDGGIAWAGLD